MINWGSQKVTVTAGTTFKDSDGNAIVFLQDTEVVRIGELPEQNPVNGPSDSPEWVLDGGSDYWYRIDGKYTMGDNYDAAVRRKNRNASSYGQSYVDWTLQQISDEYTIKETSDNG